MILKTLVRPEHLNHHGNLFGGYMLQWVDEYAYIAALDDYPTTIFVTRGMEAASFTKGVKCGAILSFDVKRVKEGRTSVSYHVDVWARNVDVKESTLVFSTGVTFCAVNEKGEKTLLPGKK